MATAASVAGNGALSDLLSIGVLGVFVGSIVGSTLLALATFTWLWCTGFASTLAWLLLCSQVTLALLPLPDEPPTPVRRFMRFACESAASYFPTNVVVEDAHALNSGTNYVIGLEPHSALPTSLPIVFASESNLLPDALHGRVFGLATSACFYVPIVRHIWWWWGIRPVTRESMIQLLEAGKSVVMIPGGVQECLHMEHGRETAYVSNRTGFIKVAVQTGSHVIPAFAFGQSATYTWIRPGPPLLPKPLVNAIARVIGFIPLIVCGRWFSPIPHQVPMTVVLGKPIVFNRMPNPDAAMIRGLLDEYIGELKRIFDQYKEAAGYPDMQLHVL